MSFVTFLLWVVLGAAVALLLARLVYRQLRTRLPRSKLRYLQPYTPHRPEATAPAQEEN